MAISLPWGLGATASQGAGVGGPAGPSVLLEDPCRFAPNTFIPWGILPPEMALWKLEDCEDNTNRIYTNTDLSSYIGKVVKISGEDESWLVIAFTDLAPKDPQDVVVLQEFADCTAAEGEVPSVCACWPPDCSELKQQYRITGNWATRGMGHGGSCFYNPLDVIVTYNAGQTCLWELTQTDFIGVVDKIFILLTTSPNEWFMKTEINGIPASADIVLRKTTGSTPAGSYTPDRECNTGGPQESSAIHIKDCVVTAV